jgi:hypothetical protein
MADELEDLAAKGRASDAKREAEQRIYVERKDKERAEDADLQRFRALSWWAMFVSYTKWIAALFLVIAPLLVASVLTMIHFNMPDTTAKIFLPIPVVVGTLLVMLYARFAVRRAVRREGRWAASLPFAVTGYLECLGSDYGDNERAMYLTFQFDGELPAALRDILASDGGDWKVSGGVAARDPGPRTAFREDHNRKVVRWFHKFVAHQLLPLHGKYPFRAVRVDNYRTRQP